MTGTLFFVPSATFLDDVGAAPPAAPSAATESEAAADAPSPAGDGSLGIGSLSKGTTGMMPQDQAIGDQQLFGVVGRPQSVAAAGEVALGEHGGERHGAPP